MVQYLHSRILEFPLIHGHLQPNLQKTLVQTQSQSRNLAKLRCPCHDHLEFFRTLRHWFSPRCFFFLLKHDVAMELTSGRAGRVMSWWSGWLWDTTLAQVSRADGWYSRTISLIKPSAKPCEASEIVGDGDHWQHRKFHLETLCNMFSHFWATASRKFPTKTMIRSCMKESWSFPAPKSRVFQHARPEKPENLKIYEAHVGDAACEICVWWSGICKLPYG